MPSWSSLSIWKRSLVTKSKGILGSKTVREFRYYIHKKPEEKQDSPLSTQHKDPEKQFLVDWKRYLQQWFPTSSSFDKQTQFVLSFLSNVKTASVVDPMYLLDSFTRSSNRERLEREKRKALYEQVIEQLEKYDAYCTDVDEEIRNTTAMAFSGGGVLGNAYVGALSVLEKHGLDYSKITKLAGTSAGALTGLYII